MGDDDDEEADIVKHVNEEMKKLDDRKGRLLREALLMMIKSPPRYRQILKEYQQLLSDVQEKEELEKSFSKTPVRNLKGKTQFTPYKLTSNKPPLRNVLVLTDSQLRPKMSGASTPNGRDPAEAASMSINEGDS